MSWPEFRLDIKADEQNTPPVELDEKLRKILYPSPPPPLPATPTPPSIQLYSEHYYPTGSRLGSSVRETHPQPNYNVEQPYQHASGPPQTYPPPPQAIGQIQGWVFTPHSGWIFIPPPHSFTSAQPGYSLIPPPPPPPGFPAQTAYPSPYSDIPSESDRMASPQRHYHPRQNPQVHMPQHHNHPHNLEQENFHPQTRHEHDSSNVADYHIPGQTQSFPRGILRDTSSEASGHGRSVKFRETPDYASPELYAQEIAEYPEPATCSPPQWKLRKPPNINRRTEPAESTQDLEAEYFPDRNYREDQDVGRYGTAKQNDQQANHNHALRNVDDDQNHEIYHSATRPAPVEHPNGAIPSTLAAVHQQLVSDHGGNSGVSGKRSGRTLVRNLESLAEMQCETSEQVSCALC